MAARYANKNRCAALLLALLLCGGASGIISCATPAASAGIAVSNIPLENKPLRYLGTAETVVDWWSFDIGCIALPLDPPPVDEAMKNLLREKKGDALVNLRYWTDRSVFLFIIIRQRFYLKADVVKLETRGKQNDEKPGP